MRYYRTMKKSLPFVIAIGAVLLLAAFVSIFPHVGSREKPTAPAVQTRLYRYVFRDDPSKSFVVKVVEPNSVSQIEQDLKGEKKLIVSGVVVSGDDGYNSPWGWHLDPSTIVLGEMFTEVCDSDPSIIQENLQEWLGNRYCPWGASVDSIVR